MIYYVGSTKMLFKKFYDSRYHKSMVSTMKELRIIGMSITMKVVKAPPLWRTGLG